MRDRARLITLPISHYCEKARWALDRAGVDYVEEPHLPLFHRRATRRVGAGSVPVLVAGGRTYADSAAIVRYADANATRERLLPVNASLRSEAVEMERYLDRELGPHSRRWAYGELLPHGALLRPCFARGVPALERAVAVPVVALARRLIRRGYRIDAESASRSLARLREVFGWIDDKLADGRPFLVGAEFTSADVTFASLAAPLVMPPEYGGAFPAYGVLPAGTRAVVDEFRGTRPGRFALELYARHRRPA